VNPPESSRRRELVVGCAIAVVSLAVLFAGIEIALQVYHILKNRSARRNMPPVSERVVVPSSDPALIFELAPGYSKDGFTVNSLGMADDEVTLEKPEGIFRIAFVGDSVSANFGFGLRSEIYLETLAEMLNQQHSNGRRFESLNFGVNAYSIGQSLRVAQTRALEMGADVIVAQLCLNDPYPSDTAYARLAPRFLLRSRDLLFRIVRPDRYWAYNFVERNYDDQGWVNVREGLAGFAALARERPVLAVLFPYLYEPAYSRWGFGGIHAGYRREADAVGVPFVDLLPSFREAGLLRDEWPMDPLHPNAEGHALAARVLRRELESRGWLPEAG
jgi:lysophospholipase L1-like esterase